MAETKRRTTPVRLREPQTVPISDEDYRQAIAALALMIHQWWAEEKDVCKSADAPAATNPDGRR
jgi:hypothetical protein